MYEIIQRIIDIDKQARELTQEAVTRRATSSQAAETKKKEVTDAFISMARARVDVIRSTEVSDAQRRLDDDDRARCVITGRMNSLYEEQHSAWVDTIVNRVTNGDDLS